MSDLNEILNLVPTDQVAQALGVDEQSAEAAIRAAVPSLLAGMQSNVGSPEGAESLTGALSDHSGDLVDGSVNVSQIDTADGQKIVSHVLGDREEVLAQQLSGANTVAGIDLGSLVRKALPILAPIVLSYLAKKWAERGGASADSGQTGGQTGGQGGGLGDLLGGLLGGILGGGAATPGTNPETPTQTPPAPQQTPQQSPESADANGGSFGGGADNASGDPLAGARGQDPNVQDNTGESNSNQQSQSGPGGIDLGSILGGLFGGR